MPLIVVKTQVNALAKKINREKGYRVNNVSDDFAAALDRKVREVIGEGVERAHQNLRKTVMGKDI